MGSEQFSLPTVFWMSWLSQTGGFLEGVCAIGLGRCNQQAHRTISFCQMVGVIGSLLVTVCSFPSLADRWSLPHFNYMLNKTCTKECTILNFICSNQSYFMYTEVVCKHNLSIQSTFNQCMSLLHGSPSPMVNNDYMNVYAPHTTLNQ